MVIAAHQDELRKHRLFELIEASRSAAPLARMARALSWWPMVFQDVQRLNVERIRGAALRRRAEAHRVEDAGHDGWFLRDLRGFAVEAPGLGELFGDGFQPIRHACYVLVGEACRDQSDAERVALVLVLESTGHVFFERVAAAVERLCPDLPLRYFARFHLEVEQDHAIFTESADLDHNVLSDAERARSEAAVARMYRTFADIFAYLADCMSDVARTEPRGHRLAGAGAEPASVRGATGAV